MSRTQTTLRGVVLALGALAFLFPFYYMVIGSLQARPDPTVAGAFPHPSNLTLENYAAIDSRIGLLTGLGPVDTVSTMTRGFGEVMMEAGLLIGWGVLIGAMLNEMGAVVRLVEGLLRVFGRRGIPYALGLSFATYLQTIFVDALIVIAAPLARRIAPRLGPAGTGIVAVTFAVGLEMGIVMMVPGFAAVAHFLVWIVSLAAAAITAACTHKSVWWSLGITTVVIALEISAIVAIQHVRYEAGAYLG